MIPLEDTAADIVGKAQRGLCISDSELAERAGLSPERVRQMRDGQFDGDALAAVAPILELDTSSLVKLAQNAWTPEAIGPIAGLAQFNTKYGDMTVNA